LGSLSIALLASFAAWLVARFAPETAGSGIPHVERELRAGSLSKPHFIISVKFLGGLLAIGGGLVLGREGPSVQMGSEIGHLIGRAFQRNRDECHALLAAGAGASLATACNAPSAGAIFVLEELVGRFDITVTITTLGASASAHLSVAGSSLAILQTSTSHRSAMLISAYFSCGSAIRLALGETGRPAWIAYTV
jgi:CIC family chloride channel protein